MLLFFGWVGVVGSYFLQTAEMDWSVFLPASSVGLLSVGVLNLNNMRDIETDRAAGKYSRADRIALCQDLPHGSIAFAFNLSFLYIAGPRRNATNGISIGSVFPDPLESVVGIEVWQTEEFDPLLGNSSHLTLWFNLGCGILLSVQ